jgi:hypothetical protein
MIPAELKHLSKLAVKAGRNDLARRINRQWLFQLGYDDKGRGEVCRFADGSYCDGYYADDDGPCYVTESELSELRG